MADKELDYEGLLHRFFLSRPEQFSGDANDIVYLSEIDSEEYIGHNFYIGATAEEHSHSYGIVTDKGIIAALCWELNDAHEEIMLMYRPITTQEAKDLGFPMGSISIKDLLVTKKLEERA